VQKLRTESKPEDSSPDEILDTLLVESGALDALPTDENKLLDYLRLEQLSFDFATELGFLGSDISKTELRAALSFNDRVVATQSGMGDKRNRFSIFHEIGHYVLPEHVEKIFVDTDHTLSWWTKVRLERAANQFAADLLFQGNRFTDEALSLPVCLKTVLDLSPQFGASYEASLRRYTERHVTPCALIVYDKVARNDESFVEDDEYRIQYTITSQPFKRLYFSGQLTCDPCKASEIFKTDQRTKTGEIVQTEVIVEASEKWRFTCEVFSNGYKIFQFLSRLVKKHPSR
jgi:hypothetical protein